MRQVPRPGGDGGRLGALGRAGAAADQGGDASAERLGKMCRGDQVDVAVDPAGGQDLPVPAMISVDGPITRAGSTPSIDVGVAGLADRDDAPVADSDVGLDDAPVVEDDRAGDDEVRRALGARRQWPGPSTRGSSCRRRRPPRRRPGRQQSPRSTSISRSVSASLIRSPAVGPYSSAYARGSARSGSCRSSSPGDGDAPAPGTTPGARRARRARPRAPRRARTAPRCRPGRRAGKPSARSRSNRSAALASRSGSATRPGSAGRRCWRPSA